jgi:hypothetical protein
MEAAQAASRDLAHAIMISSTGDLVAERTRLRELLTGLRHPVSWMTWPRRWTRRWVTRA